VVTNRILLLYINYIVLFLAVANVSLESSTINVEESIGNRNICLILSTLGNIKNQFAVYFSTEAVTATGKPEFVIVE